MKNYCKFCGAGDGEMADAAILELTEIQEEMVDILKAVCSAIDDGNWAAVKGDVWANACAVLRKVGVNL